MCFLSILPRSFNQLRPPSAFCRSSKYYIHARAPRGSQGRKVPLLCHISCGYLIPLPSAKNSWLCPKRLRSSLTFLCTWYWQWSPGVKHLTGHTPSSQHPHTAGRLTDTFNFHMNEPLLFEFPNRLIPSLLFDL